MLQTDPLFLDVILFDVWYPYYETSFDVSKDHTLFLRSSEFQCDFLRVVLSKFPRVRRVPCGIFKECMQLSKLITFGCVTELSVCNSNNSESYVLDFRDFLRFTNLRILRLENVFIDLTNGGFPENVENLSLISSYILSNGEGDSLERLTSNNMRTLDYRPLSKHFISTKILEYFIGFPYLKELSIYIHSLKGSKCIDGIQQLKHLRTCTLYSHNNYHFSTGDHKVFENVFEKLAQDRSKYVDFLKIYGIPDKFFFRNQNVKPVVAINWAVDKIFHKKSDGSVEWSSGVRDTIQAFYKFVATSKGLKTLFVDNNIIHSNRLLTDSNFENDLQTERLRLGYDRIEIISKPVEDEQMYKAALDDHFAGYVTIVLQKF